ncbi:hypothetical protein M011DRAFT_413182 [Sporormia fimetaria CBS 119925]|uniref:Serine-rich protein n=1 Tax=Sporormia fimetaria CBS 119925 TaxID=1340428 RepID=A0A6A6UV63_9PLEO|nr:hypothetical protein M011DRAFT_413182 [Sporormia fimetaria CBS 119925]
MSSSAESRTSASKSPVLPPLANAPRLSPSTSRKPSPFRGPLHERSSSQSNELPAPTIRVVDDIEEPSSDVYSKKPFPSQPSQILPPRKKPGYAFETRGSRVLGSNHVANVVAKFEANKATQPPLVPQPLQPKRPARQSTSTSNSDADTIVPSPFSPSSSTRFSIGSTAPSSVFQDDSGLEVQQEETSGPSLATIRTVPPSTANSEEPWDAHALTPKASAVSLASTASEEPSPEQAPVERASTVGSGNFQTFGADTDYSSSPASTVPKQASPNYTTFCRPNVRPSSESLRCSPSSFNSERPRSSSSPARPLSIHDGHHVVTLPNGARLSYPIVRQPSASRLTVDSQPLPKNPARMNAQRGVHQIPQWSSQLSTIASESERNSRSVERVSPSVDGNSRLADFPEEQLPSEGPSDGRSFIPGRRPTIVSFPSTDSDPSPTGTQSSVAVPLPLFSPLIKEPTEERNSDELQDTISPLQSPPLKNKRSFLRRRDSDSRSTSSRPGSAQSNFSDFIHNNIPAWARVYYREGRGSLGAESYTESTDSFRVLTANSGRTTTPSEGQYPLNIYRPRNRPHQHTWDPEAVSVAEAHNEKPVYVVDPPRRHISQPYTPRLRPDRRSTARFSAWKAPSLDETLGTLLFSRQNRQIVLFALGFLCPFAWMIASFLALPPDPSLSTPSPSQLDLERHFVDIIGPVDDRSYQKGRWWRNLNRIMAAIGTLLVGVIVSLVV